jgi:hypothetical protein
MAMLAGEVATQAQINLQGLQLTTLNGGKCGGLK